MKASPLSLRDVTFLDVHIQLNPKFSDVAKDFNFEDVIFTSGIRHGCQNDDGTDWWVGLEIGIDNETGKQCPYHLNVKAAGMFSVNKEYDSSRREQLVFDSGVSLVYGVIREMVMNITSRSAHGSLMLPTASFVGSFAEYLEEERKKAEAIASGENSSQG